MDYGQPREERKMIVATGFVVAMILWLLPLQQALALPDAIPPDVILPDHVLAVVFWGRAFERVLITLFGGGSIYLGFRLFSLIGEGRAGDFETTAGKFMTLKMKNVGAGVFFAALGTICISFIAVSGVSYRVRPADGSPGTQVTLNNVVSTTAGADARAELEEGVRRLAMVKLECRPEKIPNLDAFQQVELRVALNELDDTIRGKIDALFEPGSYSRYVTLHETQKPDGSLDGVLPGEKAKFDQINKLITDPRAR